jgi:hypothetical protein
VVKDVADNTPVKLALERNEGGVEAALKAVMGCMANKDGFEVGLWNIDVATGTSGIVISLLRLERPNIYARVTHTALAGSLPHEYTLANSSPTMLRHHLVCCMQSPFTAIVLHSSSRSISRKHSSAAMFIMCARGVSAVLGVAANIMPFNPR